MPEQQQLPLIWSLLSILCSFLNWLVSQTCTHTRIKFNQSAASLILQSVKFNGVLNRIKECCCCCFVHVCSLLEPKCQIIKNWNINKGGKVLCIITCCKCVYVIRLWNCELRPLLPGLKQNLVFPTFSLYFPVRYWSMYGSMSDRWLFLSRHVSSTTPMLPVC